MGPEIKALMAGLDLIHKALDPEQEGTRRFESCEFCGDWTWVCFEQTLHGRLEVCARCKAHLDECEKEIPEIESADTAREA